MTQSGKPKAVALFAGAGGLSQGFIDAGFDVVFATDHDSNVSLTYQANHPNTKFLLASASDPEELSGEIIFRLTGLKTEDIDVVFGGPPCRGFSMGNRHNGGLNNPHNALVREFVRLVQEIQPRWFLMENVTGLLYMDRGKIRKEIIGRLEYAYKTKTEILNAADFGVPQLRRRTFFVGNREDVEFIFPVGEYSDIKSTTHPQTKRHVRVIEAIGDLPSIKHGCGENVTRYTRKARNRFQEEMRRGAEQVLNHVITKSNAAVIARYKHIPPGGNWSSLSDSMIAKWRRVSLKKAKSTSQSNLYLRLDPNEPSPTVGNFRKSMFIHPQEDRGLSVREAARLQSFPDRYVFKGGISSMQQQVANATPPLLARAVAGQIPKYIKSDEKQFQAAESSKS